MTFKLIETKTLSSTQASVEFTSIPQDGTDLLVVASMRDTSTTDVVINIGFNGSGSNFAGKYLYANPAVGPASSILARYVGSTSDASTANTFNSTSIYIFNYTSSTYKSFNSENVTENNATNSNINNIGGVWENTAAITSLVITPGTGSWRAGTIVSLYKITKGSSGGVVVS